MGRHHIQAAVGTGPVDAAYKAIDSIVGVKNTLLEFNIHAVTEGIDAHWRSDRASAGRKWIPPRRIAAKRAAVDGAPSAGTAPIPISSSPAPKPTCRL